MKPRPVCTVCKLRPCAVNYHKEQTVYYRKRCELCLKKQNEKRLSKPLWQQSGYKKKHKCERCGFHSKVSQIFSVFTVDGNLRNTSPINLRTVCANCQILISVSGESWKNADLTSDF